MILINPAYKLGIYFILLKIIYYKPTTHKIFFLKNEFFFLLIYFDLFPTFRKIFNIDNLRVEEAA